MGCISSKAAMSRSYEDLNQKFQTIADSNFELEHRLISSSKSDKLVASVRKSNSALLTANPNTRAELNLDVVIEPVNVGSEESSKKTEKEEHHRRKDDGPPGPKAAPNRRSRSFHWSSELEVTGLPSSRCRSRTIHTVEEFDALLERAWFPRKEKLGFDDQGSEKIPVEEAVITEENKKSSTPTHEISNTRNREPAFREISRYSSPCGKGIKRKAVAQRLESLKIPPPVDFAAAASLENCVRDGKQVYSPEASYVTPKFGSYSYSRFRPNNTGGGDGDWNSDSGFIPELVAAFEECIQELEAEAESIIVDIAEKMEEDGTMGKLKGS